MTQIPAALITKYAVSGPRYTSYPTVADFTDKFDTTAWRHALTQPRYRLQSDTTSLYVHVPFCQSLCYFCACNKIIPRDRTVVRTYLNAIKQELFLYQSVLGDSTEIVQLHLGGGSPSFLNCNELEELIEHILCAFPRLGAAAELSIELDPRTTTAATLKSVRCLGFNRLSFGVQDFSPQVQKIINRIQPFELVHALVEEARRLNFSSINFDLLYGLPAQTPESFAATVDMTCSLSPHRIALYGYAHVPWAAKAQNTFKRYPLPSAQERVALLRFAIEQFRIAGYEYIGMDHFARPEDALAVAARHGTLTRNFMGYTTAKSSRVLAIGPSAISSTGSCLAQNEKSLTTYTTQICRNHFATARGIVKSFEDQMREDAIQLVMCVGSINIPSFEQRWESTFSGLVAPQITHLHELERDGLIALSSSHLQVTPLGRFFLRNIAMLFDCRISSSPSSSKLIYSQAI